MLSWQKHVQYALYKKVRFETYKDNVCCKHQCVHLKLSVSLKGAVFVAHVRFFVFLVCRLFDRCIYSLLHPLHLIT